MLEQNGTSTSRLVINIIVLVVVICSVFLLGIYLGETNKISLFNKSYLTAERQKSYDSALKYARDKLISANIIANSITSIKSATVKSVSGQNIVVEFNASEVDLFKDGKMTRTVQIPSTVVIEQRINKTSDEIKKIMDEYDKKMKTIIADQKVGKDLSKEIKDLKGPEFYTVKKLQPKDLKIGDVLSVQSEKDIYTSQTFEANAVKLINRIDTKLTPASRLQIDTK